LKEQPASNAGVIVLLFSLAATPEHENHGAMVAGVRDWSAQNAAHGRLLVLIDEAPYAARMAVAGGADERMEERRRAWQAFVGAYALTPCFVALGRSAAAKGQSTPADENRIDSIRAALWQPGPT
jgi:hypothetical protein